MTLPLVNVKKTIRFNIAELKGIVLDSSDIERK